MAALVLDYIATPALRVYVDEASGAVHCQGDSLAEGIMVYGNRRQLITPEAVRDAAEKWDGRTVITVGHPALPVTPSNVQDVQAGDVGNTSLVIGKGGFSACRVDMALRRQDAIDLARSGRLTGLSRGHTPIIDPTPGTHPVFGAYDERRIGHTGTNHIALCGDSAALPPPRGGDACGIYLDAAEAPQGKPMTRKEARKILADAKNKAMVDRAKGALDALGMASDAVSIDKALPMIKELMADPIGALVLKALVAEGSEPSEPPETMTEENAAPMDPAAMDARIAAAVKPLTDALDVLKTQVKILTDASAAQIKATKDAADAAELAETKRLVAHYKLDAKTDRAALLSWARGKAIGDCKVTDADPVVLAALRAMASRQPTATKDADPTPINLAHLN